MDKSEITINNLSRLFEFMGCYQAAQTTDKHKCPVTGQKLLTKWPVLLVAHMLTRCCFSPYVSVSHGNTRFLRPVNHKANH
jgi:hypothetical protein